jgi:hypothetical protein
MKVKLILFSGMLCACISAAKRQEHVFSVNPPRLTILYCNRPYESQIARTPISFWQGYNAKNIDTVTIESNRIISLFDQYLRELQLDKDLVSIPCDVAFLRLQSGKVDTIYTDRFFRDWLYKGKLYTDNDSIPKLRRLFGGFVLFH